MLAGYSFGTAAALYVAAHRPVAGVILQDAPALRQLIVGEYGWWNLWLLAGPLSLKIPGALDSIANAKAAPVPAIFLIDELDTTVPPKYQDLVIQAYTGTKQVISVPDAHHVAPLRGSVLSPSNASAAVTSNGRTQRNPSTNATEIKMRQNMSET